MPRSSWMLTAVGLLLAALFVRLGFWQLDRLDQRRAVNAQIETRFGLPAVPLESLRGAPEAIRYRRVLLDGSYDFANELALANRSRRGSPGVHVLTPVRILGTDTVVLAVRGWVYAADAAHADLARWQEDSTARALGYVDLFDDSGRATRGEERNRGDRIVRRMSRAEIARLLPYPIAAYFVVALSPASDSVPGRNAPPRLDRPMLGEGNHLSYAIQWFSFAAIAVVGLIVFLRHHRLVSEVGGQDSDL